MLLSEKDLINAADHFDFLVRPTLEFRHDECQIALSDQEDSSEENQMQKYQQQQQQNRKDQKDQKEGDKFDMLASTLKLKIPTSEEFRSSSVAVLEDQENVDHAAVLDGFKTPTSLDHKIPATLKCPPAPRKPKSLPPTKRKVAARRRVLLDLASEIELLFPPAILADLGGKIKKVRQGSTGNIIL